MIHARADYNRFQEPTDLIIIIKNLLNKLYDCDGITSEEEFKINQELNKYKTLSKGSTLIAEDEPVMLFRAKDKHFVNVIGFYRDDVMTAEGDPKIIEAIDEFIPKVKQWQRDNGTSFPDIP